MTQRKQAMGEDPLAGLNQAGSAENSDVGGIAEALEVEAQITRFSQDDVDVPPAASTTEGEGGPAQVDEGRLNLDAIMDITMAASLKERLERVLSADSPETIEVDGSKVEKIDTTILQMLVVFIQAMQKEGRDVCWTFASDSVRNASRVLGLSQELRL